MGADRSMVYLDGRFVPRSEAKLDVEDRGVLFADGVYEVLRAYGGHLYRAEAHLARLRQSLEGLRIAPPADVERLIGITLELLERNGRAEATVYWQVTRGVATRDRRMPAQPVPTVLVLTWPTAPLAVSEAELTCRSAILQPDRRWGRCWIKSLMLLDNVLAAQAAAAAAADEAIYHRDGTVTEGTAANVFIVHGGRLITTPADEAILAGITRARVIDIAAAAGLDLEQRHFNTTELATAEEVMLTGTTTNVAAVTNLDGVAIGSGEPGPVARQLHTALLDDIRQECGLEPGWS